MGLKIGPSERNERLRERARPRSRSLLGTGFPSAESRSRFWVTSVRLGLMCGGGEFGSGVFRTFLGERVWGGNYFFVGDVWSWVKVLGFGWCSGVGDGHFEFGRSCLEWELSEINDFW